MPTPTWFDVLQRVSQHAAKRGVELTPRVWKTLFCEPAPAVRPRPHQGSATSVTGGCPERPGMSAYDVAYLRAAFAKIDLVDGSFDAYAETALGVDAEKRRRLTRLPTEPGEG